MTIRAPAGFGNEFYLNPNSNDLTLTINANGNTVKGGTYFIFVDKEKATSVTINGQIQNNNYAKITGKRLGNATEIAVTSGLTWTTNVEPEVPKDPAVTPTTDSATGKTTITPAEGGNTAITVNKDNTATITTDSDMAVITLSFSDTPQQSGGNGTVSEVKAAYKPATRSSFPGSGRCRAA